MTLLVVAIFIQALLCFTQVNAQAQVAPDFEPAISDSTITVYVDEDTQPGDVVTTIRAREVIHETLVYRFYPWSTNHYPPWIRPDVPNPDSLTVFNQDIYRINSADGTVTAGDQVQTYIRLQGNFIPAFTYNCTAWFESNPSLTSTIFITFISRDVNEPPSFTSSGRTFRILFTQPIGYLITRFTAQDNDLGPAGEFRFSMVQSIPDVSTGITYFALNEFTGDLSVLHILPLVENFRFLLVVTVQDEGGSPLSNSIDVNIYLDRPNAQAPVFSASVYIGSISERTIPENAPGFVLAVNASDPGHDPTPIDYSITSSEREPEGDDVIFAVEQTSGHVTVWGPLDRERESRYLFHVQAAKRGTDLISSATVVVHIQDINERPVFLNDHYIAWVSEHANVGEPIHAFISAVDNDEGQNGLIQYSITAISGRATTHDADTNELGSFSINSFTGAIFVNTDLEREATTNGIHYYEITVVVTDGGLLTDTAFVSINITDVNDNRPYFDPSLYVDTFYENQPAQFRFPFQAFDLDERDQATLRFHLEGAFNERFSVTTDQTLHSTNYMRPVTETEGSFYVSVPLDREERDHYQLLIVAQDITATPLLGYANVTINILDVNDNDPVFVNDFKVTFDVREGSLLPDDLLLERLTVTDADIGTNAIMDFAITSGSPATYSNHFSVVRTGDRTADLFIAQEFDRENIDSFQFIVTVTDRGTPGRADTIDRCVSVLDINDCVPTFNPVTYTSNICEGIPIGTVLHTITATDCDIGDNQIIHYSIESTEGVGLFTIDEITGVLTIADTIDYEQTGSSIVVEVVGRDLGSPPNSATATVTVNICDCNDNGPVVSAPDDGSCILENSPTGTIVRTFTSTDIDTAADNTDHVYVIESGGLDAAGNQVLCIPNDEIPTITVCGPIDKEQPLDYITVTVLISNPNTQAGCGLPIPQPVRISYNICVDGVNDNPPELSTYTVAVSISECGGMHLGTAAGARVTQLIGSDRDRGEQMTLSYTLAPLHSNFLLDSASGILTVSTLGLDYEQTQSYSLSAYVEDNGSPNLRSSQSVAITVTIIDCNDNPPISAGIFSATIDEHTAAGTEVLTMTYQDADTADPYGMANFYITGGPGAAFNHFALSVEGVLTVRDDIDRESEIPTLVTNGECQAVYQLTVELRDNIGGDPTETLRNEYTVTIYVNDINDNNPVFDPVMLSIMVAENNDPPNAIDHALATDRDCGTNADLRYVITSQSSTATDPLPNPYFDLVTSSDPTIRATQILDRESADNVFTIVVTATDQGTPARSGVYTLTVTVSDTNDHPPILMCPSPTQEPCTYRVCEDVATGTVVDTITSTDQDPDPAHSSIRYSITNSPSTPFDINRDSGAITVNRALDCETTPEYYLTVVGEDSSADPDHIRMGSIVVHILCCDVNDNCPVFQSGSMYAATLPENAAAGTALTLNPSIYVTDADITASFRTVRYEPDDRGLFTMDSSTGVITTLVSFDYEASTQQTFQFTVRNVAPGCGTPDLITGTVIITILDRNDNPPVCYPIPLVTLQECVGITTAIDYPRPTDRDSNENGRLTYRFGESHDEDFQINPNSGDIQVFQSLDREMTSFYSFDIIVTDGGDPPMSCSTTLSVNITDCNDEDPVCPETTATFQIDENTGERMSVGTFLATDADIGNNALLTYTIATGNSAGHFQIRSPATPGIGVPITIETTNIPLDRETTGSILLTIEVRDGGNPTRFCFGNINIEIRDLNDNCPMFNNLVTSYSIDEDLPGDEEIARLVAVDPDTDESNRVPITYAITSITPSPDITIDPISGGLHTQNVDFERVTFYRITVSATDSGTPDTQTCTGDLTVNINDVNDNPPIAPDISVDVIENSDPGTFVGQVRGNDVDTEDRGEVRYTLIGGNIGDAFQINNVDGSVTVWNDVIDRETLDEYTLTIRLYDLGNPSLTSTSLVSITVLDENDNHPQFSQLLYTWSISEGSLPGQAFIDVEAWDIDLGINADILYSIDRRSIGNEDFEATPEGHIRAATTLDRETRDTYELTVIAMDQGNPVLMNTTSVHITVTDINDNTPIIIPFLSTAEVKEHDPIGNSVHQFVGGDPDLGDNALFYFSLSDTHDPLPFTLSSTGHLSISGDIDLEAIVNQQCDLPHYYLTVEIIDNGTVETVDHTRSSVGHINITVRDINDHIPRFTDRELRVCINENNTVNAVVHQFTATDDDCEPDNIELYFFIVEGTASARYFSVDLRTGTLRLKQTLDREMNDTHEVYVAVTNYNNRTLNDNYQLAMISTTTVCVEDSNDNPPQCLLNPYVAAISQDIAYGAEFATILTTDRDIGNHSVAQYELIDSGLPFLIERNTGILTTIAVFHDKVGDMYNARIRVYDNYGIDPSLDTICDLRVYVVSNEYRIIITIGIPIEFVRSNITAITTILQQATGCLFGIDSIRPRTNDDNTLIDISQTDIIVHGIDPITFEIKPRDPIIVIIDQQFSSINASMYRAVNAPVHQVRPYPVSDDDDDDQDLIVLWIIIAFLATIALIGCCCFICCYCWERRRRKLVHKELKSVVSLDQFEHTDAVNQNPLWIQPYAEWQEESQSQEIVIDVEDEAVSEVNMIYASQELEIPVTHPGEEEESDDEQKNVQPPAYSDNYKKLGRFVGESQSTGMKATHSSSRASGGQRVSVDSYEDMPGDLGGGFATRTVSYKKTTSFKKTIEVPESTETVTVTHMTSPIETDDDKAGLLDDDQMITYNFDD